MTRHYSDAAFSLDGRYLQAIAMSPELEELHAQGIYQCFAPCVSAVIDVIDLEALEVSATYEEPMGAEMLVGISRW
jgi:hypothetical protein